MGWVTPKSPPKSPPKSNRLILQKEFYCFVMRVEARRI